MRWRTRLNPEQYKDFKALTEAQFPQGLCFPLVALWTRDLLTERHSLRAMVRAPDSIVHHSQLSLARDMQSEHMTRVRKRVAQNKFGPQARQEVELENKVLGAYTGLAQKPRIHKRAIADGAPARRAPHATWPSILSLSRHFTWRPRMPGAAATRWGL